jgi:hypothetical protein
MDAEGVSEGDSAEPRASGNRRASAVVFHRCAVNAVFFPFVAAMAVLLAILFELMVTRCVRGKWRSWMWLWA